MDTAVVTGAGRGFGKEIARRLAQRGYAVLLTDVDEESARSAAEEIGSPAWAAGLEVTDPEAHRRAAREAASRGPLKVWVNNAGILRTRKVWEHPDEEARALIEIDLLGVVWGSRAAVEAMREHGGHILNLGSMSSFAPVPGLALYASAKHGVLGFTISLQGDLDNAGIPIRTHVLCPDTSNTRLVTDRRADADSALLFTAPRLLEPGEVADLAMSLIAGERLVLSHPRSRGALLRLLAPFPRLALRVLPYFTRQGEKRRAAL